MLKGRYFSASLSATKGVRHWLEPVSAAAAAPPCPMLKEGAPKEDPAS